MTPERDARQQAEADNARLLARIPGFESEADRLTEEAARLRAALERYGEHDSTCSTHDAVYECDCGFDAISTPTPPTAVRDHLRTALAMARQMAATGTLTQFIAAVLEIDPTPPTAAPEGEIATS